MNLNIKIEIMKARWIILLASLAATGCGVATSRSVTKGFYTFIGDEAIHDENAGKQTMVPELQGVPVKSVVVALNLITRFGKRGLIENILNNTDIESVVVTAPMMTTLTSIPGGYRLSGADIDQDIKALPGKSIILSRGVLSHDEMEGEVDTIWARDWAPIVAQANDDTHEPRLMHFNYFPDRLYDGSFGKRLESDLGYKRVPIPLFLEGGNFVTDGFERCFVSSAVTNNESRWGDGGVVVDIPAEFRSQLGCPETVIFPRMPYEGTGHLDMWMKFVKKNVVIVGQIVNDPAAETGLGSLMGAVRNVRTYLDDRAAELEEMGYDVKRIPMPKPSLRYVQIQDDTSSRPKYEIKGDFLSFTNSLILDKDVFVPYYVIPDKGGSYPDADKLLGYKRQVKALYEAQGFTVHLERSDNLIRIGGAIHCVTMQIPDTVRYNPSSL